MPFQPGNQEQRKGDHKSPRVFKQQLISALNEAAGDVTKLRLVADALIAKALEGDVPAINALMDRVDGKVPQTHGGDEDNPFRLLISRIELVPGVNSPG